jgi:hypothetical protein
MAQGPKRPIDIRRESAGSMTIGTPDDGEVVRMFPVDERLFIVKERAVYALQLADQIDPGRTTPSIPDSQQRVFDRGATDPIVARLLLTAHVLFRKQQLGENFDEQRAMKLAWDLTKQLAAMDVLREDLEIAQSDATDAFRAGPHIDRALKLPTVANLEAQFHAFAQKLGHAVDTLKQISRLFYPGLSKKWIDGLCALTKEKLGAQDPFSAFVGEVAPLLLNWRELRNLIEHEDPSRSARAVDFHMLSDGTINAPMLEVQRVGHERERVPLIQFMSTTIHNLTVVAEALMAHLCNANIKDCGPWPVFVMSHPEEELGTADVRLGYVIRMPDGTLARLG